jgi:hypothetical protein
MTRRRGYPVLVWLLVAALFCCAESSDWANRGPVGGRERGAPGPGGGSGLLAVTVTVAPVSPVERFGEEKTPVPAPGVGIRVLRPDGTLAGSARTDERGEYRFRLAVGSYRVELDTPLAGMMFTKDLPAEVTVYGGKETRLDVTLDTGIR